MLLWSLLTAGATAATFANILHNGTSIAQSISVPGVFDGPKLTPAQANETTYDWYYFSVVSASTNASLVVVFWNNGPKATRNPYLSGPYSVTINGTFDDGSQFSSESAAPGGATISNDENGISVTWEGSGFSFTGTGLDQPEVEYVIKVDNHDIGIQGNITLKSRAPAHYPCGPNTGGQTEQVLPHIFQAQAVPDADTAVHLNIGDRPLSFTDGVGYYEKTWGDAPLLESINSWYWGHARFGPYSVVWFDVLDPTMTEYFSGYVAKDGQVLAASCAPDAVVVRPWGFNSGYPPTVDMGLMQGLYARFQLDDGTVLAANITMGTVVFYSRNFSARMLGTVAGGIEGSNATFEGRALFELLKLEGLEL